MDGGSWEQPTSFTNKDTIVTLSNFPVTISAVPVAGLKVAGRSVGQQAR